MQIYGFYFGIATLFFNKSAYYLLNIVYLLPEPEITYSI